MATVTDIVNDIKADLTLNGSDYDARLVRAVQTRLRELRGKRYWFLRAYSTLTTTANSETIDVTDTLADFSVIDSLDLIANGSRFTNYEGFNRMSFDDLRATYWTESTIQTGTPEAWSIQDTAIYLSHKASTTFTLPISYYKQDATLPAAGGTSIWFDQGYDVIRAGAQYIFKRDTQGMTLEEADKDMMLMAEAALGETHINNTEGEY